MSFLLPTLVLLVASTALLLAARIWKRLGSARRGPAAPGSPPFVPCGCGPGCGPCLAAARELRELVTPLWPGASFPQDSELWKLLWEDLERLLERGHLPCCASPGSLQPSRSLRESPQAPHGRDPAGRSGRSLGAAAVRRSRSSLRMHMAKKSLEVKLRAQPTAVRRSRQRRLQQEGSSRSSESLPCSGSPGCADIGGARSSLRMHVAKKSLEIKLRAWPAPVRSSQERAAGMEAPRSPSPGSRSPSPGSRPCSQSEKILQRQRELEFPHLRGAPPSHIWPLLAAQTLLRMLCLK